jgi:PAT family beta-lactamase induction signal transducer AmpG
MIPMPRLFLAESPRVRYATGAAMYFAQGVPFGLMNIALPAWLVSKGVGAAQVASYLAVLILPWAFKLLFGPLMDRWTFLPMGRRRPWVLGAQAGLAVSFLALCLVEDPVAQFGTLMLLCVLVNTFAATQDVAVDGMAIDLTPTDEQGRLNAFMTFGKAIGWSATSAVSGTLLVAFGLGVTALAASAVSALVFLGVCCVRERDGERILPWSSGAAMAPARAGETFAAVFRDLHAVLWSRASLVLMAIMVIDGMINGYGHALMPIAAVKLFGFSSAQWSQLVALMGLTGAVLALGIGPLIDRFGSKRMLLLTTVLVAVHAVLLAETQVLWTDAGYVRLMLAVWVVLGPVTMVCVIALGMANCSSASSATQFAIYMSVANLGSSVGSKAYGMFASGLSYPAAYLLLGGIAVALVAVLMVYRHRHPEGDAPVRAGARPYGLGAGGGMAGSFWSGAMRCPKCRADMEPIHHDGLVVDRCASCLGLWFDDGEVGRLRTKAAAKAIDTGSARIGRAHDAVHDYRCPRCGGHMIRRVDPQQPHIGFEECSACHGSYFDAGEFSDLSTRSIADLFKRLRTAERA